MDIKQCVKNANLNIDPAKIYFNEPMSKHTTFKIGGLAECFIKVNSLEELIQLLNFSKVNKIPVTIIGNGSNVLVLDSGIKGLVLKIDLQDIQIQENGQNIQITIGSGFKLAKLGQICLQKEISGFEELSAIPGTIGGAVKMNAGAHGKEMKDIVKSVTTIDYDGNIKEFANGELQFAYRKSIFDKEKYVILQVKIELIKGKKEEIKQLMDKYANYRKEKQPIEYPSAGSTFKRGEDYITAKLIDDAGLKGYKIGDAMVSTKHSGFIINTGNATAQDVLQLIEHVKKVVYEKFNKKIELEIEVIGDISASS